MTCNFSMCISYGNCTEWSDFKSNSCCALVWFWNHVEDFRPKLHDPKFNYHFITSILKSHNLIAQIQTRRLWSVPLYIEPVSGLSKSKTRNALTSRFENMSGSCQRDVIASCDWLFCFTVLFSLAEKKMWFRAKNSVICE